MTRQVIYGSVALYFLGILPVNSPNWGVILNQAYYSGALASLQTVHWVFVPVITIVIFTVALTLFAQAADQVSNPQVRTRHAKTAESTEDFSE